MKKAKLLFAACALLPAAPAFAQLAVNCTTKSCEVTVIVPAGCGSGIHVAPDPIVVEGAADITWIIRSSKDWVFQGKGIEVNKGTVDFAPKSGKSGDTQITLSNKNTQKGLYKYDIILAKKGGDVTTTCRHDPTIVNW